MDANAARTTTAAPPRRRKAMATALFAAVAIASGPGWAETAADRAACTPSVLRLCPREALALDRRAALQCLIAKLPRATPQCQAVVRGRLGLPPPGPARATALPAH